MNVKVLLFMCISRWISSTFDYLKDKQRLRNNESVIDRKNFITTFYNTLRHFTIPAHFKFHNKGFKLLPLKLMESSQRKRIDCRTRSKISGILRCLQLPRRFLRQGQCRCQRESHRPWFSMLPIRRNPNNLNRKITLVTVWVLYVQSHSAPNIRRSILE